MCLSGNAFPGGQPTNRRRVGQVAGPVTIPRQSVNLLLGVDLVGAARTLLLAWRQESRCHRSRQDGQWARRSGKKRQTTPGEGCCRHISHRVNAREQAPWLTSSWARAQIPTKGPPSPPSRRRAAQTTESKQTQQKPGRARREEGVGNNVAGRRDGVQKKKGGRENARARREMVVEVRMKKHASRRAWSWLWVKEKKHKRDREAHLFTKIPGDPPRR